MNAGVGSTGVSGTPPKVVVVIINWNGLQDTLECLESVGRLHYANVETLVIDNGSDPVEARRIEQSTVVRRVVRSPVNLGSTGGANLGFRDALQMGAEYVWFLNNDVVVDPDSLTKLVALGEQHSRIGLLSPVIYHYDEQQSVQLTGTKVDFEHEAQKILRSLDEADIGPDGEGFALAGTALLIKRRVLERVGGFDERLFAYVEDTDYSVSAMAAGFDTALVRDARVYHKYGRSLGGRESPVREYLYTRNMYLFWTKHLKGRWRRRTYPVRYVAWVLERAVYARRRGQPESTEYILAGGWDALRGKWGSWETRGRLPRWIEKGLTRWILDWHPYFWTLLLRGDCRGFARGVATRLRKARD